MKIKKRVTKKKDVMESAELQGILQGVFAKIKETLEKYRLLSLTMASIVIILVITTGVYYYLSIKWNKETSLLEFKAYNYYLESDYNNALSTYQEIINNYSHSKSAPMALYYLGNSYSGLGQIEQAIDTYQKFIKKYPGHDTILPLVYINLGYSYITKKDFNNAIAAFKKASSAKDSLIADRAVYETARAYEASGENTSAIEQYEYLTKTYPASPWSQEATAKINKAKGSPK